MEIYRGDIFYVRKSGNCVGSEQEAGRPCVIVSNNTGNYHSNIVEIVPLTTAEKHPLPTHVSVMCQVPSTALCECIQNVSQERLGEYIRSCTDAEMDAIDKALMVSLGLNEYAETSNEPVQVITENEYVIQLKTERDLYKNLYEQLFERMVK